VGGVGGVGGLMEHRIPLEIKKDTLSKKILDSRYVQDWGQQISGLIILRRGIKRLNDP